MSIYDKECSICKKGFSLFWYDYRHYSYKVRKNGEYIYQCSYPCYCKELDSESNKKCSNRR